MLKIKCLWLSVKKTWSGHPYLRLDLFVLQTEHNHPCGHTLDQFHSTLMAVSEDEISPINKSSNMLCFTQKSYQFENKNEGEYITFAFIFGWPIPLKWLSSYCRSLHYHNNVQKKQKLGLLTTLQLFLLWGVDLICLPAKPSYDAGYAPLQEHHDAIGGPECWPWEPGWCRRWK